MATVAIVLHHDRKEAVDLAREAIAWLGQRGHEACVPRPDAEATGLAEWSTDRLPDDLDLGLSLGGDGTMLRTVDLLSPAGVPVLGVNVGRLGYLTEVEPGGLEPALDRFFSGGYQIEERMTLSVAVTPATGGPVVVHTALNEAVVERMAAGHSVRLAASINGRPFTTYTADGLIVATPTGSTAYNFSARGPIVSPHHKAIIMTPVSPHSLFDRSLVLDPAEVVRLEVIEGRRGMLSIDGHAAGTLLAGDAVECRTGAHDARLVTFRPRDFLHILKTKFGLADG